MHYLVHRLSTAAHWLFLPAAVGIALIVSSSGCRPKTPAADTTAARGVVLGPESYAVATEGTIESGPVVSGTLRPREQATVRSQVAGAILRAYVDQGERVGRGALLAAIDDRSIRDNVTSAQAAVVNAERQLELALKDEERQKSMIDIGALPQRELDNAHRSVASAQAAMALARAQLIAAQKQLALTRVTAPFAGVVSEQIGKTGDIVQQGSALYTIVDPSSMELEGSIPSQDLDSVRVGDQVQFEVNGYPGRVFSGRITRINPVADPTTRQVRIYVDIANEAGTLVGQLYAEGRVVTASRKTLMVPRSAIDTRGMRPEVTVVRRGAVARERVTVGLQDDRTGMVEIMSGIRSGDTVLTGAANQIAAGTTVTITAGSHRTSSDGVERGGVRR